MPATEVDRVVDLGCGPGHLTGALKQRWPCADVLGLDSSPAMAARAQEAGGPGVRFEVGDLRTWTARPQVDVLVANASLQWVPGHLDLLPRLVAQVVPGGWFAFQVPGNFAEPSHVLLHRLAAEERFRGYVDQVARAAAHGPEVYQEALLALGCEVGQGHHFSGPLSATDADALLFRAGLLGGPRPGAETPRAESPPDEVPEQADAGHDRVEPPERAG